MTQFNLANELRRGGTGLLAQAVADIAHNIGVRNEADWLRVLRERAAAVPAGNQAKAPTALDELRALSMAKLVESRPADCACYDDHTDTCKLKDAEAHIAGLDRELAESREALARAEAERDELKRKLTTTAWLLWDVRTKSRSELEEANWGSRADEWLDVVLPGKAASEAEVTAGGWRKCTKCRGSGIVAGAGEYLSDHCSECQGGMVWRDPEATESATKEGLPALVPCPHCEEPFQLCDGIGGRACSDPKCIADRLSEDPAK